MNISQQSEKVSAHLNLLATFIMCHNMTKFCRDMLTQQKLLKRSKADELAVKTLTEKCSWPPPDLLALEEVRRLKVFSEARENLKAVLGQSDELDERDVDGSGWINAQTLATVYFAAACHNTGNMQGLVKPLDKKAELVVLQEIDKLMQEHIELWSIRREIIGERFRLNIPNLAVSLKDIDLWKETRTVRSWQKHT